ncbi:MAG: DJ-1/PfpI family protein [Opitutales bacterium]|nr:DJ-1/PfpI family protein [Opitutales bacterium]
MPKALVFLTNGFEEMETVAPVDFLRRAGVEVTLAAVGQGNDLHATGRNKMVLRADTTLADAAEDTYDLVVVPGGPGHAALRVNEAVLGIIRRHAQAGAYVAAICAGPTVLLSAGVLEGRAYTAHFSVAEELPGLRDDSVVQDGKIITSRGAGTAHTFALALVEAVCGKEAAQKVAAATCLAPGG